MCTRGNAPVVRFQAVMWILVYVIFYYERIVLGNHLNNTEGHRGLFWYGLFTQAGAFTGAVTIFLMSSFHVFKERSVCVNYACS